MTRPLNSVGLVGLLTFVCTTASIADSLPALSIDKNKITVSGPSAGGAMAQQYTVTSQYLMAGVGSFAGVPFGCAEKGKTAARKCMEKPETVAAADLATRAQRLASEAKIPPTERLKNTSVYLFHGRRDTVVNSAAVELIMPFYVKVMGGFPHLKQRVDTKAEHGIPTEDKGEACSVRSDIGLLKCGYDGVGEMLRFVNGSMQPKAAPVMSSLTSFDQSEFTTPEATMEATGHVYIPTACRQGGCGLHLALHGCRQNAGFVGDSFNTETTYNAWAEANRMVVLYPQVAESTENAEACWDWWGYTGADFLTSNGPQTKALDAMVARLTSAQVAE